jgi:transposase IS66 family protein/uncharacterized protein DUF6444
MPGVPDSGDGGLRAANTRLRELLDERDARIGEQAAENAALRELVTALQSQVADLAAKVKANSRNSSRPPSSDGPAKPSPKSLRGKSGRKPGRPKGQPGAPYDTFGSVAGHALCGAHVLRELVAVTETGTDLDRTWAQQAIDALLALNGAADAARAAGQDAIDPETRARHEDWYRQAAATGIALSAARQGKLQQKRHALATRMRDREADYLRFARDPRVPFTNNPAEQAIRMSKLRIKISGCMRSMAGAEELCALRSYLATAARQGTGALDALTTAFQGDPWIPETGEPTHDGWHQ